MLTQMTRLRRGQEGFTLIELLVVVAIIALLATFAVPKLFEAIGKAKVAPGQADLQTISAALERYYLDNNSYPTLESEITNGYVKASTSFLNGFKQNYLYGTTADGDGYFLIDLQGVAAVSPVVITCGTATHNFTLTPSGGLSVDATITAGNLPLCAAPTGAAIIRN